jgi:hypothetical protein
MDDYAKYLAIVLTQLPPYLPKGSRSGSLDRKTLETVPKCRCPATFAGFFRSFYKNLWGWGRGDRLTLQANIRQIYRSFPAISLKKSNLRIMQQ